MDVAALAGAIDAHGTLFVDGVGDADELVEVATQAGMPRDGAGERPEGADALIEIATTLTRAHEIRPQTPGARLNATLRAAARGDLGFSRLSYGAAVSVSPGGADPENFLLPISLHGTARVRYGSDHVVVDRRRSTIIAPYREFRSNLDAHFDHVLVTVPRARLESVAARLLPEDAPPRVDIALDAFAPPPAMITMLIAVVQLAAVPTPQDGELQRRQQSLAVETLLLSIPAFRRRLPAASPAPPRGVAVAVAYMTEHLDEPLPIGHVAQVAGVTARGLQSAFRREFDRTPTQWLREARLDRARDLIMAGAPHHATITDIAGACGMFHAGEFAARFRARFGESPSSMLRDARRRGGSSHSR